ncbi:MAG: GNAT family N-acetyltransferase [Geminicoccaceae bacterium]
MPIAAEHRARWQEALSGYATFYKRELTDAHAEVVWGWLQDPGHELEGRLALVDGRPVGLAHFRRMPSPLRGADIGFLDDLFVDPETRAKGIGRALIEAVALTACERG